MPSPFPGMDPYLESDHWFADFHFGMLATLQATLNRQLRPTHVARIGERTYLSLPGDPGRRIFGGENARCEIEVPDRFIELWNCKTRIVETHIELVRREYKIEQATGRAVYLDGRTRTISAGRNWVEFDFLRDGLPTFKVSSQRQPHSSAIVFRASDAATDVYSMTLRSPLPTVQIPLVESVISLDLQAVFDENYDRSSAWAVDYKREPVPPLSAEDAAWADALLREKGLRP